MFPIKKHKQLNSLYINGKIREVSSQRNNETLKILENEINSNINQLMNGGVILVKTYENRTNGKYVISKLNDVYYFKMDKGEESIEFRQPFMLEYSGRYRYIFSIKDEYIVKMNDIKLFNPRFCADTIKKMNVVNYDPPMTEIVEITTICK